MKLITEVSMPDFPFKLDHHSPLLMMGSCFTEHIGKMLNRYLYRVCINPFGVTYNPLSVKVGLEALLEKEAYTKDDLDLHNDLWFSFDHDTGFSTPDVAQTLQKINHSFNIAKNFLLQARFLVITWGTAWVFHHNASGKVVCNCHKIPADRFARSRLNPGHIVAAYDALLSKLFKVNPDLKVIFTVSPIRHWKDGAHGNQLSKATLLLAQESLANMYQEQLFYFPSYEIIMDELRDYRFYSSDMIHISNHAISYIWEKFENALISEESRTINRELDSFLKMMEHRPSDRMGKAYLDMTAKKEKRRAELNLKYPSLAWDNLREIGTL